MMVVAAPEQTLVAVAATKTLFVFGSVWRCVFAWKIA
jgi:hypothetical protein